MVDISITLVFFHERYLRSRICLFLSGLDVPNSPGFELVSWLGGYDSSKWLDGWLVGHFRLQWIPGMGEE